MTVLMKKTLLLIFLFCSGFGLFGQDLSFSPDQLMLEVSAESTDEKIDFTITNNGTEDLELYWSFEATDGTPDEWWLFLCDVNLCYTHFVSSCPCNKPNFIDAGQTVTFMMHINPNQIEGTGSLLLKILPECDATESILDIPIAFTAGNPSSTEFQDLNHNISIYPNPTAHSLNIKEDQDIETVIVYNLIGKKIRTFKHSPGQSHDVSDLAKGIYLIRMLNADQNIVKVSRLTKR